MAMYPASRLGSERHTLSVLVENRPGVLARIAGLFARHAFNTFQKKRESGISASRFPYTVKKDGSHRPFSGV